MPPKCAGCLKNAVLKRPKTGDAMCRECFFYAFEEEIHHTITDAKLFTPGDHVAIGASGGKDSTVLAYVMKLLNDRHGYGLDLELLSIDEGITGYRDDSLETVKRNKQQYGLPLKIISYEELYGWTMDAIVKEIGRKNNCTFCGVFRRQALDRGAMLLGCNKVVTGHNADDIAETIVMNILRGDIARLQRCTAITTGSEGTLPRCKPFKYTYEKEIVMYAYFKRLDYFSTECIYSPNAYRGHARAFIKDAEKIRATAIIDIIHSGESLAIKKDVKMPTQGNCSRCGYVSSQLLCKACLLLEGLNSGLPKLGIGKTDKIRRRASRAATPTDESNGRSFAPSLHKLLEAPRTGTCTVSHHSATNQEAAKQSLVCDSSVCCGKSGNVLGSDEQSTNHGRDKCGSDAQVAPACSDCDCAVRRLAEPDMRTLGISTDGDIEKP